MDNIVIPEPKKKSNTGLIIILILIIVGLIGYIAYDKVLKDIFKEEKYGGKLEFSCEECYEKYKNTTSKASYVGNYGLTYAVYDNEGNYIFDHLNQLYLRDDNTFRYFVGSNVYAPGVGTYEVKDNQIILNVKYWYGSDESYHKDDRDIILDIESENVLSEYDNKNNKKIYFIKDEIKPENSDDKAYYSAYPIDGRTIGGHTWHEQ